MPKAKGRNAFFFFMLDWRKRAEAQGRRFPNGLKDVTADSGCNEEWQSLTKQEKGPYEAMAKQDKVAGQIQNKDKKTTFGELISDIDRKEKEKKQAFKDMQENIKFSIDTAINLNILPKSKFCFMHVNHFFSMIIDNNVEYFPAEYALGIFSFEDGIEDVHHIIVSAEIPLGYRREALETSQNSHNIPVEYQGGETEFAVMYKKLINFLEPRKVVNKYPPLYTTKTCFTAVQSVLGKLCDAAQEDKDEFKVYELEELFIHLADEGYKKRTDVKKKFYPVYAQRIFICYNYIHEKGFECSFHKFVDGGSEYCSKSILQQWAWILCKEFCDSLGVNMRPGIHYPDKSDVATLTHSISNLEVGGSCKSKPECNTLLSMTGVSEHHRLKVSSRTYQDEIRRRTESKPVEVIDYSKLDRSIYESVDKPVDKSVDKPVNELKKKHVPSYLGEQSLRPPNIENSYVIGASIMEDYISMDDEQSFPPIGGRGVPYKSTKTVIKKPALGKGQGHA
ncbi:protein maelstrom 2 isoform X1 [Formica exsecta]|uniref:protein maelstrom 2 isoform X1 n=2 Tax=Formica exsecta TaxID=72781 RepID=UPI001141F8F6|nr:protein maelstrom 2 isoform X1 [Formica exsecta]XP_029669658.1 protein maelstrom 2 isoform X1 [Formica exsecta]